MTTYFYQTVPDIVNPELPLSDKLNITVRNTGNYFFETGVKKQLDDYEVVTSFDSIPENADKLILSMSNFLSPNTDLGFIADRIEKKKIKQVVMIGAGAQSNSYSEPVTLSKGTERFLQVLSHKSETIGVRGEFTQETLRSYGVDNGEVIGCPSIFLELDKNFKINKPKLPEQPRIVTHYTPTGYYRDNLSHLNNFALEKCCAYIAQSEKDLISVVENKSNDADVEYMFSYYNNGKYSNRDLRAWFSDNTKWFFDINEWFDFMRTIDFSIGARFHGNMGAIQVGTPALNLVFDTRTRELCEYLNLPTMFLDEFNGKHDLLELYDLANYDLFNATFSHKYERYTDFLDKNGVSHKLLSAESKASEEEYINSVHIMNVIEMMKSLKGKDVSSDLVVDYLSRRIRNDRTYDERKLSEQGKYQ